MTKSISKILAVFAILLVGGLLTAGFTGIKPVFGYIDQKTTYLVGSSTALASTTAAYVCTNGADIRNVPQNNLAIKMQSVAASGSTFNFYFEYSPDNTNWYSDVTGSIGASTTTLAKTVHTFTTANASVTNISVPRQASMNRLRVCYLESGAATQGGISVGLVANATQD